MKPLAFTVTPEVTALGVKILTARISAVKNSDINEEFNAFKDSELSKLTFPGKEDPVLEGFRELHTKVGRSNRDYIASPEKLRWLWNDRQRFPHINTIVDIYNFVSLKTGLALGAHDLDKVNGNITLRLTTGAEIFLPLGQTEPKAIHVGEYGYIDDANNILCRLEVLQCEPTKITIDSTDLFIIVQGNANTSADYVQAGAREVCNLITKYCGGSYTFLNSL